MKTIVMVLALLLLNSTVFAAADSAPDTVVGTAIGKAFLGEHFQVGTSVEESFVGKNGCKIDLDIDWNVIGEDQYVEHFAVFANDGGREVEIQSGRSSIISVENVDGVESISFETESLCTGGFIPGSADCDLISNKVSVRRDSAGRIQEIEVKNKLQKVFQRTHVVKCQF